MNTENSSSLENELALLTKWSGETPELWHAAFANVTKSATIATPQARRSVHRWLFSRRIVTVAAAVIGLIVLLPSLNYLGRGVADQYMSVRTASSRVDGEYLTHSKPPADLSSVTAKVYSNDNAEVAPSYYYTGYASVTQDNATSRIGSDSLGGEGGGRFGGSGTATPSPQTARKADSRTGERVADARHVIRKATIELRSRDVRAAFARAALLVSEAGGEFVQESTLSGQEDRLQANLTLRVAAERLSTVLQALRELGEVRSEAAGGEDVTSQVVDLEARLKNERRVEQELLQLLESRKDAPLKEVLELRTAIDGVRQSIETMTAQRERLSRLVSLATVLVLIRTPDAPDKPVDEGIASYLATSLQRAALRGVRAMIDTLAGLTLVLIGGGIWIVLAILAGWVAWRALRRPSSE